MLLIKIGCSTVAVVAAMMLMAGHHAAAQTVVTCQGINVAVPAGHQPACSKNFKFTGTCTGVDNTNWSVFPAAVPNWHIVPWEQQPISIIQTEIMDETSKDGHAYFFVGNDQVPDIMGWLGAGRSHATHVLPEGYGWHMPSSLAAPASDYIDLHGLCPAGTTIAVDVTFTYEPIASLPAIVSLDANAISEVVSSGLVTSLSNSTLTVGSGKNRALVAQITFGTQAIGLDSCTWTVDGKPQMLTRIVAANTPDTTYGRVELWGAVAPASGRGVLSCTWATPSYAYLNGSSFTGVDQSKLTAFQNVARTKGYSPSPIIAVNAAPGDLPVAAMVAQASIENYPSSFPPWPLFLDNSGSVNGTAAYAAKNPAESFLWRLAASAAWAAVGVDLHAAGR